MIGLYTFSVLTLIGGM